MDTHDTHNDSDTDFNFRLGDENVSSDHPVYTPALSQMEVEIVVNKKSDVWILHNKEFEEPIAWIEFDAEDDMLTFVSYRGAIKGLGVKVQPSVRKYLYNARRVFLIETEGGEIFDFFNVALVVRDARAKNKKAEKKQTA